MKIEKLIISKEVMDITITEARLLTKEEAEALPERLKLYNDCWWTSTADADYYRFTLAVLGYSGSSNYRSVDLKATVRPALIFKSNNLKIGDMFYFGNKEFEVIKESLAFCMSNIGLSAFRTDWQTEDANQYEKSDIKKYVDEWFEEAIK